MPRRAKVVIVGGGITGLATAHALLARDPDVDLLVFESATRPGGNITTERAEGFTIDAGPDSWVAAKPQATALARALGLEGDLVGTLEANRRVYVAHKDGLCPLPEGFVLGIPTELLPIVTTPLFSIRGKIRMGLEPFVPRRALNGGDESIASFVGRRLGREVAERLVAPLLGGIYGGDATKLSIRATLPQFVEAEREHGSLVRAMQAQRRGARGRAPASAFTTLRGGIGGIIEELERRVGERLKTGTRVTRVSASPAEEQRGRFVLEVEGGPPILADHVVLAVPANAASRVLSSVDPRAAEILGAIPHASTGVVFLAFKEADVHRRLDATGYIVPRSLGSPALAATWVSSKWGGRAPTGSVLVRVFLGGAGGEEVVTRDDPELVRLAREEAKARMNVRGEPILTRVHRFMRASAQPLVGHLGRIAEVNERLAKHPGLYVAGSGYDGVGIPDCVRQAETVAVAIHADLIARPLVREAATP
jgi:oxygen-dependent protoporphyrinogen oxidase